MTQEENKYEKLDILYNTSVRCPYCKSRILKYTNTCPRCGIQKQQIYHASNRKAKQIIKNRTHEKIFLSMRRPNDVSFTGMILCLILGGWFGLHCFKTGRWLRGTILAVCMIGGVTVTVIFHSINPEIITKSYITSFLRIFPSLWASNIGICMWAYDFIAVVFAFFKYPVRLGEAVNVARKK